MVKTCARTRALDHWLNWHTARDGCSRILEELVEEELVEVIEGVREHDISCIDLPF